MISPHVFVYLQLGLALLPTLAIAEPSNLKTPKNKAESDYETFQRLLAQADPPSLHAALHDYSPRFKHGMFREDKSAVEFIHRDDASLATSIIKLAKRQENLNGTLASTTPPTESPTPTVDFTTLQTSTTPGPIDRTSEREASIPNTESTPAPDSTLSLSITLTSAQSAPDSTSNAPALESSTESSRPAGSVYTFTDSSGVVVITTVGGEATTIATVTPSSSTIASDSDSSVSSRASVASKPASKSSVIVRTTTLPDGSKSTVTAITVVPGDDDSPTPTGEAGAGSSTRTGTAAPGVQTGFAIRTASLTKEMLFTIGGIAGVAMLW